LVQITFFQSFITSHNFPAASENCCCSHFSCDGRSDEGPSTHDSPCCDPYCSNKKPSFLHIQMSLLATPQHLSSHLTAFYIILSHHYKVINHHSMLFANSWLAESHFSLKTMLPSKHTLKKYPIIEENYQGPCKTCTAYP